MRKMNKFRSQKGSILPITIVFVIVSTSMVFAYFKWAQTKRFTLNRRVAHTKAYYNAESGLAETGFKAVVSKAFTQIDSTLPGRRLDNIPLLHQSQWSYTKVDLRQGLNETFTVQRIAEAEGEAHIRTVNGEMKPIHATASMAFDQASLAEYMYLTESERAGGHPFVFNSPGSRREVTFGAGDDLGGGNVQTNGQFVMSDYGCPVFHHTVWLTYGQPFPDMGMCNFNLVFQGEPDTLSKPPINLPPSGYETTKNAAKYVYDATEKLNWMFPIHRDTLIMTELTFIPEGFRVRRWWFLKPPHWEPNGGLPLYFPIAQLHLDWSDVPGGYDPYLCLSATDLRSCYPYQKDLLMYHAKFGQEVGDDYYEQWADNTILASHGLFHYDYPMLDPVDGEPTTAILQDEVVFDHGPTVIYVKGGPVRVRGEFSGRYTVVTDEYQTYRRHAWNNNISPPYDTLWCNIWITGDLTNAQSSFGNMGNMQPVDDCSEGSDYIMGLVSGANVFIANTQMNRSNVKVNAAIVAFNESFAMHYCQNTCTSNVNAIDPFGDPIRYCDPPYGDGRGPDIYGGSGNGDDRGVITLWGGIVQKYRGYMMRNNPGPYNTGDIGMDKNYYYDRNLTCGPPPYYPSIEFETDEVSVNLVQYGVSE